MFLSKSQPCFAVWAFLLHQKKTYGFTFNFISSEWGFGALFGN